MNLFPTPDSELIFLVCGVQMYTLFLNTQLLLKQNKQSFLHQHTTPLFTGFYNSGIKKHIQNTNYQTLNQSGKHNFPIINALQLMQ